MTAVFFQNREGFRNWLKSNHEKEAEILVGYYKSSSGVPSITWTQSVEEALCFGWIDGARKPIDKNSYCIRFSPRRPTSIWSNINIKKAERLIELGSMQPSGLRAFTSRKHERTRVYSYENVPLNLPGDFEKEFRSNKKAWKFFEKQSSSYKRKVIYWILNAKYEIMRRSRLQRIIRTNEAARKQ